MKKGIAIFLTIVAVLILMAIFGFRINGIRPGTAGSDKNQASILNAEENFPPLSVSPKDVRAVYLTAAAASVQSWVDRTIDLIKSTRLDAVVINVKDSDGIYLGEGMKKVVEELRNNGIYPIARIVVFQDNTLAKAHPELALKDATGGLWAGNGGYFWLDPASKGVWDRTANIAEQALDEGFAEVNFDYVRFPDGDVSAIVFPFYDKEHHLKVDVMKDFFKYITEKIHKDRPGAILSADLFADSFIRDNGLGVGQRVGDAASYFDVVSPMVYPSHYAPDNFGFPNPATEPYQVVFQTLESGKKFLEKASSTAIIRPWIQDFNMGAVYDAPMVKEEMRAIKDAGYGDTWMDWNPRNVYDPEKFLKW